MHTQKGRLTAIWAYLKTGQLQIDYSYTKILGRCNEDEEFHLEG